VERIFSAAGLRVYDVMQLPTHGGSLRIYGCHAEDSRATTQTVDAVLAAETRGGLRDLQIYKGFQTRADKVKDALLGFLLEQKRKGKTVAAYGAAAKGNTLLNYAGIKPDLLSFVCDSAAAKQGMFMPGSHIPIVPPSWLEDRRPDYLLMLPWNIAAELKAENIGLEKKGTRFLTAVPALKIL
jgi:hypothetical protein